ncbi:hypothetical protein [Neptunicella sp.]|uniref:hypothetical protein n=1 Tax=Neptunicella sp. TaxID=2125986 RepID=UPI003F68CD4C
MAGRLLLLVLLYPSACLAEIQFWQSGIDWLQSNLQDQTEMSFNHNEFNYDGITEQNAALDVKQIIGSRLVFSTSLFIHRQHLQSGVCKQNIAITEYQIMPQFQLQTHMALGVGIRGTIDSQMSFAQDQQIQLENQRQWFVRLSLSANDSVEYGVKYSSTLLDAHDFSPLRQTSSFTDNALSIFYHSRF